MKRKLQDFAVNAGTALAIGATFICLNVVLAFSNRAPWDVSAENLHSLSPAAAQIIRSLPEPIKVTAYISADHPPAYDEFIRSLGILLDQYADASHVTREVAVLENGQKVTRKQKVKLISWDKVDPDKLPRSLDQLHDDWLKQRAKELNKSIEEVRKLDGAGDATLGKDPSAGKQLLTQEDLAKRGIRRRPAFSKEGRSINRQDIYLALELEYRGKPSVIIFQGSPPVAEGLEYEFTKRLKELAFGLKKVGLAIGSGSQDPRAAQQETQETSVVRNTLAQQFEVQDVQLASGPVPDSINALVVAGKQSELPEPALRAIDAFVMKGRPVLFLVDGMSFQGASPMDAQLGKEVPYVGQASRNGLDKLLTAYGFQVDNNIVIDASHNTTGFVINGQDGFPAPALFPVLQDLDSGKGGVLEGMKTLALGFLSSVKSLDGKRPKTDKLVAIARTSGASFSSDREIMVVAPGMKLDPSAGRPGPFVAGYAVIGTFRSAFAPPAPAESSAMSTQPVAGEQSPDKTRMVVIGDADLLSDLNVMMAQQLGSPDLATGIAAVANAAGWLTEDTALSRIRNKGSLRRIEPISDSKRTWVKVGNVAGPPLLLIVLGIVAWRLRDRRRRKLKL